MKNHPNRSRNRRLQAASEILDVTQRHSHGRDVTYTEIAGVLLEYRDTILSALNAQLVYCERCERGVHPAIDQGDHLCPHCGLVL